MEEYSYPTLDPNKKQAKQIWDERYEKEKHLFGKEPSLFIRDSIAFLKKGKALDVAMGTGRHTAFLASQGFQVEGMDCSAKAIELACELLKEKSVTADIKTQNLDFFLMKLMNYDTIVMTYYRPVKRFFDEIRRGLAVNGTFILEAYTVWQHKNNPSPYLEFEECYQSNEILQHLKALKILYYNELKKGPDHLVQVIALKDTK